MKRLTPLLTRWRDCSNGIAAVEFAMLLPVMVVIFFGLLETSNAMTVNRKVAISANTLADLTAQSEFLYEDDIDDLFEGVMTIVEPNDPTGMQLRLISVILDSNGDPVVHWSRDSDDNTPYAAGDDYTSLDDDTVLSEHGSLIVVEMVYVYTPGLTSHFIKSPITFSRQTIRWPRLTNRVQLCDAADNCTT
ncbi:TadE/TadG family type IV pilus assembly protein [Hyphococcus luteus]|jgi:Flp pilus assembly protein TadG|nr:TadE/TadG family type IV pilus assembly protein [Marinicaulis flavus]